MNPRPRGPEVLKQIETRPPICIQRNQLAIKHSSRRETSQTFGNVWKFLVQLVASARIEGDLLPFRDSLQSEAIQFNFFCGVRRYVALLFQRGR